MRKILFVIPAVMAVLLTGCPQGVTEDPTAAKTTVQFDNRERGFPVTIYTAHARQDADKITVVTPNTLSRKIEWAAGRSYFYISYHVALDALLRIIYTPTEATQGVMVADIEADQNNVIPPIPPLDSIVQRDTLMTEKVYFSVENRGSDPCRVLMADRVLLPSNMASGSGEIVSGGTGLYEVKEGSLSGYKIDKSGRTYNFPSALARFEAGHYYAFTFTTGEEVTCESAAGTPLIFDNMDYWGYNRPVRPENVRAEVSGKEVIVSWNPVTDADSYRIYYLEAGRENFDCLDVEGGRSSRASLTDFTPDTTYEFWVTAINFEGESEASVHCSVTMPLFPPARPRNFSAVPWNDLEVILKWEDVPKATSYRVYRSEAGETGPYQMIGTSVIPEYTDEATSLWVTYHYQVSAVNDAGEGERSLAATPVLSPGEGHEYTVSTDGQFSDAFARISYRTDESGIYIINLTDDIYLDMGRVFKGGGKIIFLRGDSENRSISFINGSIFVSDGATLVLDNNVTLNAMAGNVVNNLGKDMVTVYSGGRLVMKAGSAITEANGYGVRIESGGTFSMAGGKISGNGRTDETGMVVGGGVLVLNGNFFMFGGEISGNSAISLSEDTATSAGVSVINDGVFTMSGGSISNNTTSVLGGGFGGGGGVLSSGTFTMSGGSISNNTASSANVAMGGGVYSSGTFTMNGGTLSGNTATTGGGGVFQNITNGGSFIKTGGVIYGSNASGSQKNKVTDTKGVGHAVCILMDTGGQKRDTTAGAGVNLDSRQSGKAGGWE